MDDLVLFLKSIDNSHPHIFHSITLKMDPELYSAICEFLKLYEERDFDISKLMTENRYYRGTEFTERSMMVHSRFPYVSKISLRRNSNNRIADRCDTMTISVT